MTQAQLEELVLQALIRHPEWRSAVDPTLFTTFDYRNIAENLSDDLFAISRDSSYPLWAIIDMWKQPECGYETFLYRVDKMKEYSEGIEMIKQFHRYIERIENGGSPRDIKYEMIFGVQHEK